MADTTFADLPVAARADVAVFGGGPAGICAATAAAEEGADVVLVERYGFLGGMATAGLVNPFMTYRREHVQVNAGLFERILQALSAKGGRSTIENGRAFDPDIMKIVADDLTTGAGVRLLFHTFLVDAVADSDRVVRGIVADKSGLRAVEAGVFVDCTGDGDLAARAGAEFEKGRPEDGLCQPMTTYFRMANVDRDRMPPQQEINERYRAAKDSGEIDNPRDDVHRATNVLLQQVLVNLIGNALQSIDGMEIRKIFITGQSRQERVMVNVEDTGKGIHPDHLPHIFEPFYTTKKSGQGLGLGLTITQRILEDMNGEIRVVRSQKGARFEFFLEKVRKDQKQRYE